MIARCYFITYSTYGTHLLGDARSSARWDGRRVNPSEPLHRYMSSKLSARPFILSNAQRALTHDAIHAAARSRRYRVDALNVRTNHIHIVVCALDGQSSSELVKTLKYVGGAAIKRTFPPTESSRSIWTQSFFGLELHRINSWRAVVRYTLLQQGANYYMGFSWFSRRKRIQFDVRNEPIDESLYAAYDVEATAPLRVALFNQYANLPFKEEVAFAKMLSDSFDESNDENVEERRV